MITRILLLILYYRLVGQISKEKELEVRMENLCALV